MLTIFVSCQTRALGLLKIAFRNTWYLYYLSGQGLMEGEKLIVSNKLATVAWKRHVTSKLGTTHRLCVLPRSLAMNHSSLQFLGSWGNKSPTDGEILEGYHSIHHALVTSVSEG